MKIHIKQNGKTLLVLHYCEVFAENGTASIKTEEQFDGGDDDSHGWVCPVAIIYSLKYKIINRGKEVTEIELSDEQ